MNLHELAQDNRWTDRELFDLARRSESGQHAYALFSFDLQILKTLIEDGKPPPLRGVANNPRVWDLRDDEGLQAVRNDDWALGALLQNTSMPIAFSDSLLSELGHEMRRILARNSNLSEAAMTTLLRDENPRVREEISRNSKLTPHMAHLLAEDDDPRVRAAIASHPVTPLAHLLRLAGDDDPIIRSGAAKNPNLASDILQTLERDSDETVRQFALRNPSMPPSVLTESASDSRPTIRAAVARNPSTPSHVLADLARDKEHTVRQGIGTNVAAPKEIIELLSLDTIFRVRQSVASHPHLSDEIAERLSHDKSWATRELIARRVPCPERALVTLAQDIYDEVLETTLRNPGTPISSFRGILERWADEEQTKSPTAPETARGSAKSPSEISFWELATLWPELSDEFRRGALSLRPTQLEQIWREYFECWSTNDSFEDHEPFEPIELGVELNIPGAAELLARVEEFELSDRVEETRESYSMWRDEFVDWITSEIPVAPASFHGLDGFSIENTEENRGKLRELDPHHIWSVVWGDVPYLTDAFVDSTDPYSITEYFVTDQPHCEEHRNVCDLSLRVECLLCDGDCESAEGDECPACQGGGQAVIDVTHVAIAIAREQIPPAVRRITGWC